MMRFCAGAIALAAFAGGAQALQVIDDRGVGIVLERPAARIVALSPHLAEIAFAAGAGAKLAGVSAFSNHPAEARRLPVIASGGRVDLERLIALSPDLVLAWQSGNSVLQLARLEQLGLRVFATEVRTLADIARVMRLVGALAGSSTVAEERAQQFERAVQQLRERHANDRRIAVFLEIWHRPMLTVNGAHLMSDAIGLCGGRNIFSGAKTLTAVVSREQLLGARPEAIVTGEGAPEDWRGLETVPGVRAGRIHAVDPDLLYGQGPGILDGVRTLCERLARARG